MPRIAYFLVASCLWAADADLILINGKIITVDRKFSLAQAMAIEAGRFAVVGSNQAALARKGTATQVIDLKGKTVLPGLFDSHVHPISAGLSEFRSKLPKLDSYASVRRYINEQSATTPKGEWIVVPRTFPTRLAEMRMPTRELLDVATEHPVLFDASYVVIVNTLGLKLAGITRDTPNPPGGEIVRDAKGEPNGILKNAESLLNGARKPPVYTEAERRDSLHAMLQRYAEAGLTSVLDRAVVEDEIALYQKLKASQGLPVRVGLTFRPDGTAPVAEILRRIEQAPYATADGDDWLRFAVFKLTLDGGMTIGTAYQRQPYGSFGAQLYGKTDADDRGQLFIPPAKLTEILRAVQRKGWPITAHSQGGGAIDTLLDSFTALDRDKKIASSRSHLMHASFQSPEAMARARKLGVLADVQAAWLYHDGPALERVFGAEGMRYFFPLKSYVDAGIVFASGSDHMIGHDKNAAINEFNPFLGLWSSITRLTTKGKVLRPEQKISREDALRSYTIWGAHLQHVEKDRGSIEAGKLADLVVIDRDYMTCPENKIRAIQPIATVIGGKIAAGELP